MKHLQYFENYKPIDSEVEEILSFIEDNYEIKKRDLNYFDKDETWYYILIDDKPYYFNGMLANKSNMRKKLLIDLEYELNSDFDKASINKGIKEFIRNCHYEIVKNILGKDIFIMKEGSDIKIVTDNVNEMNDVREKLKGFEMMQPDSTTLIVTIK